MYPTLISLVHAPFTIFPALFPRSKFLLAQRLQPSHDVHYAQVTVDEKILDEVRWGAPKASGRWTSSSVGRRSIGNSCGMEVFNRCALMPFSSLSLTGIERQSWHLGLFRSDCLLPEPEGGKEAWSNSTRHPPRVCRCLPALLLFTGSNAPCHLIVCPTLIALHSCLAESASYFGALPDSNSVIS